MKLSVIAVIGVLMTGPAGVFAHTPITSQSKPTDQELSDRIAKAIANDTTLSADAINVSVTDGVATLTGVVGKDADRAKVEKLARVPGISRVKNNIASREKATDAVKDTAEKGATATKKAMSKTGEVITDEWIVTRIRTNIANDAALTGHAIEVDVDDQVVTMSGTVPAAAARTRALAVARDVEGVKRVVNNIKVTSKTRE